MKDRAKFGKLVERIGKNKLSFDEHHAACGEASSSTINSALSFLIGSIDQSFSHDTSICEKLILNLGKLVEHSHASMIKVHHTLVERRWRRLYTDATLLKVLLEFWRIDNVSQEKDGVKQSCLEAIRDADLAIIVAGAAGYERLEWLLEAIKLWQAILSPLLPIDVETTRINPRNHYDKDGHMGFAQSRIPEMQQMPDLLEYLAMREKVAIIRGGALHWPVFDKGLSDARWSNAEYLKTASGPGRVVPVEIGRTFLDNDWRQAILPFDEFLKSCGWTKDSTIQDDDGFLQSSQLHYLAQYNLFDQFPALLADICSIDLTYASPDAPSYCPSYTAPIDAETGTETVLLNAWIGPAGTRTPIHRDPYYNCFVQVVGHKHIWIAQPDLSEAQLDCLSNIDLFDLDATTAKQAKNAEQLSVFEKSSFATLGPGDVLIMPPGWHHSLKSQTKSFSVSMWY